MLNKTEIKKSVLNLKDIEETKLVRIYTLSIRDVSNVRLLDHKRRMVRYSITSPTSKINIFKKIIYFKKW